MPYITTCPKCQTEDSLEVVAGCFSEAHLKLTPTGYSLTDDCAATNEVVQCRECDATFSLEELDTELAHLLQDEPWDGFLTDAEADADVLASAGFGTNEDYGDFGQYDDDAGAGY